MRYLLAFLLTVYTSSKPAPAPMEAAQLFCVATAVYHEARGEPLAGQVAVAFAVKHRAESKDFPETPCAVVYQREPVEQFTGIRQARPDYESPAWRDAVEVSTLVFAGMISDPIDGARFYYNPKKAAKPDWAAVQVAAVIGNHKFWDVAHETP